MAWVKLDDGIVWHPKIVQVSDKAFRLHIAGLCYANQHLTDGVLESPILPLLLPGHTPAQISRLAGELVTSGVWEQDDLDVALYRIHDYLEYQPSKEQAQQTASIRAAAGRAGGQASAKARRQANGSAKLNPDRPSVRPSEQQPRARDREGPPDDPHRRAYDAFNAQSPGGITPIVVGRIDAWLEDGIPVDWIEAACREAGEQGGYKGPRYLEAIIKRWQREGRDSNRASNSSDDDAIERDWAQKA